MSSVHGECTVWGDKVYLNLLQPRCFSLRGLVGIRAFKVLQNRTATLKGRRPLQVQIAVKLRTPFRNCDKEQGGRRRGEAQATEQSLNVGGG